MSADPQVRKLRESLEEAQERIRQLSDMLNPRLHVPISWGLRPQEEALFFLLVNREFCEHDVILEAIKANPNTLGDNLVKVVLCRLRQKLAHLGFRVKTKYRQGLALRDRDVWRLMAATGVYQPVRVESERAAA